MREDAHEDKTDIGPRHALMQTYVDDPVQTGQESSATAASTSGAAGSEGGSGMPQVVQADVRTGNVTWTSESISDQSQDVECMLLYTVDLHLYRRSF